MYTPTYVGISLINGRRNLLGYMGDADDKNGRVTLAAFLLMMMVDSDLASKKDSRTLAR